MILWFYSTSSNQLFWIGNHFQFCQQLIAVAINTCICIWHSISITCTYECVVPIHTYTNILLKWIIVCPAACHFTKTVWLMGHWIVLFLIEQFLCSYNSLCDWASQNKNCKGYPSLWSKALADNQLGSGKCSPRYRWPMPCVLWCFVAFFIGSISNRPLTNMQGAKMGYWSLAVWFCWSPNDNIH